MRYTYNDTEIEFARYIKTHPIPKIWWNFTLYVFDYGNFYFQIESVPESLDSPNKGDEAITGQFTKHLKPFTPSQQAKLICENKSVENLYIIRAFLYFTKCRKISVTEQLLNRTRQRIKYFIFRKEETLEVMHSKATGAWESFTCHPKSSEANNVDAQYSNLIDCGLLIQIDGNCLAAFVQDNCFGFSIWDNKYFFDANELKDAITEKYEFIQV